MDFESIRKKVILPKLTDMLGKMFAESLYQKASFASVAERDEQMKLNVFVSITCSDPKFIGMWGTAQAVRQKKEWICLLG